jgi:hypothetical protein
VCPLRRGDTMCSFVRFGECFVLIGWVGGGLPINGVTRGVRGEMFP